MKILGSVLLAVAILTPPARAFGHSKQIKAIQNYCDEIGTEFSGNSPEVFSGPDPWTELDEVPADMADQALAFVYADGFAPKWVFLRIASPKKDGWSEDIDYYFRNDGSIAKRERHLQILAANMTLDETTYYDHGEVLKDTTRHHALGPGKQKISAFNDEPAPDYMTVDDLPFFSDDDTGAQLVSLRKRLVKVPDQVFRIFQPDRKPHQLRTYSGGFLFRET